MQGSSSTYLMEHSEEAVRLDVKTNPEAVRDQAGLCGIGPGAHVLDVGCGAGKAASVIRDIVGPSGRVVGVDFSPSRIKYATEHYGQPDNISFEQKDFTQPMDDLGQFDFIWVRFVLEYFSKEARDIVANLVRNLKPQGRLCLLDLDHNALNHYPLLPAMEQVIKAAMDYMARTHNFDPYAGRKLFAHMYDLGFRDIRMHMVPHHLIYGELLPQDAFNWERKMKMWTSLAKDIFAGYPGGVDGFTKDFYKLAHDPRRFTYTPMIICHGLKPEVS